MQFYTAIIDLVRS